MCAESMGEPHHSELLKVCEMMMTKMGEAEAKKQMAWFASMASTLYDVRERERERERVERSNKMYVAVFKDTGEGETRSAELSGFNIRSRKCGKEPLIELNEKEAGKMESVNGIRREQKPA